jgi:hypothetical protein
MSIRQHLRDNHVALDKNRQFMCYVGLKCGGTSIRREALRDSVILSKTNLSTYLKEFDTYTADELQQLYKFAVVRNPFARVVSAYVYLRSRKQPPVQLADQFRAFVLTQLDEIGVSIDDHFSTLSRVTHYNDKPVFDFIAKLENIKKDWQVISDKVGCSPRLPHRNSVKHANYREYYDADTIAVVSRLYAADLERFDYTF